MNRRAIILAVSLLLLPLKTAAEDYLVEHFSCPQGLSDCNVSAIVCDSGGMLWIGSHNGLDRYDGYRFKHYKLPTGNNIIRSICIDATGKIWMTTSLDLFRLNPDNGECDNVIANNPVGKIVKSSKGEIIVTVRNEKIAVIDPHSLKVREIDFKAKLIAAGDGSDIYLIGMDNGLYVSHNDLKTIERCSLAKDDNPFVSDGGSSRLEYAGGYLFSGSPGNAFAFNTKTGKVLHKPWVMAWEVVESQKDGTLIAATNQGLYILDRDLNTLQHFSKQDPLAGFLRDDAIQTVCEDFSGGIWIGTYYSGISHLTPNYAGIEYHYSFAGKNESTRVREIVQDDDGYIWFGTETDGLFRMDIHTGKIENIPLPQAKSKNVVGLMADGNEIWVGTYSTSTPVLSVDRKTLEVRSHDEIGVNCSRICKDDFGGTWAVCRGGIRYKAQSDRKFTTFSTGSYGINSIASDHRDNSVWASTSHSCIYHKSGDSLATYSWENGKLPCNYITDVLCDNRYRIWASSEGGGLIEYDEEQDRFVNRNRIKGASSFMRLAEDKRGILWATSIGGMLAFNPDNGHSRFFGAKDGFDVDKFNFSSLLYSRQDRIYAGSSKGMISFNASRIMNPGDANGIVIAGIVPTNRKSDNRELDAALYGNGKLTLKHRDNSFEIYVTNADYSIPKRTHLEYKVDGLDNDWTVVDKGRVTFTGIPTGHYNLRLRSVRVDGSVSGNEKSLRITVKPHILASIPFLLLYVLFAAFSVYVIIKTANRKGAENAAKKAALAAEKQAAENEKMLYASKVEFLSSVAHEIRTPLALVRLPLEALKKQLHSSPDSSVRENLDIIDNNSEKLGQFIDELLDFQKLEKAGYSVNMAEYDICEIARVETDRFQLGARRKKLEYAVSLPEARFNASTDKSMLEKIIWNLCSNAVKYAGTMVRIHLENTDGSIVFKVENDGEIIPLSMREEIFKPFVRCQNGNYAVAGTGLGLSTSRNFASMLGGTLGMDDDTSINRFILTLPVVHTAADVVAEGDLSRKTESPSIKFPEIQGHSSTIMIVEDNEEMSLFLKRQFEGVFNIVAVGNGKQALDLIQKGAVPNIIISDIMMPEMDGYELCRKIKNSNETSHIPVILLSAKTDVDSYIQGYDYGADAYLQKPFSTELLATAVRGILKNRSRLMEHYASNPIVDPVKLKADSPDTKFLRITQEYVMEHIGEPEMKIEELAEAASTSVSRLQKRMKTLIGIGPNEYIQQLRLKKAAELLLDESIAVSDVSLKVGFASHSYFSSSFRKKYGVTPKQYRENKGKIK